VFLRWGLDVDEVVKEALYYLSTSLDVL